MGTKSSSAKMATKKNKEDGGKKIKLSLYINKTPYKFGCLCTFCNKQPAVLHCAECPDFFCAECDVTAHSTKKRAGHVRQKLSKFDLKKASSLVTRYIRLVQHLKRCQIRCRKLYRRYFDRVTLCHYYYNSKWGYVTWRKPYCLRKEELYPFYTEATGATKIQCLYHLWNSRTKINARIKECYIKVFSRDRGRFYYCWLGKSTLIPKSNWKAPFLFGKRGYPYDIKPVFTLDAACVVIQRHWRARLVRKLFHAMVRASYEQIWDPVSGSFTYFHRETEVLYRSKPKLLGKQPWDPNFIPIWTTDDVFTFLRRIGFRKYAARLKEYGIDGKALLLIDDEDFENLDIINKIHRKKIKAEVFKRYPFEFKERASEEQALRREAIRKLKLFTMASIAIQSAFRGYLARKEVWLRKEMVRLAAFNAELQKEVTTSGIWWTNREDVPALKLKSYDFMRLYREAGVADPDSGEEDAQPEVHLDEKGQPVNKKGLLFNLTRGNYGIVKLPDIDLKRFGRKRDHHGVGGWGRNTTDVKTQKDKFISVNLDSYKDHRGRGAENFPGLDNPSKAYSQKLVIKGYDLRRFRKAAQALGVTEFKLSKQEMLEAAEKEEAERRAKLANPDSDSDEEAAGKDDTFASEDNARQKKEDLANAAKLDAKAKKG